MNCSGRAATTQMILFTARTFQNILKNMPNTHCGGGPAPRGHAGRGGPAAAWYVYISVYLCIILDTSDSIWMYIWICFAIFSENTIF